jgi:hypothetical protein
LALIWLKYIAIVAAGAGAGFINTLAGSGSAITLPMLIFLGLPDNEANATNRVGILLAALVGARTLKKSGFLITSKGNLLWLLTPAVIGAAFGAEAAARIEAQTMRQVIAVVMLVVLVLILLRPNRWLVEHATVEPSHRSLGSVLVFFLIGAYGGFLQVGVGVFLLTALVLHSRYSLVQANAIKLVLILAFTVPALAVFIAAGQVDWGVGFLMAAGQVFGAWIAATFAVRSKNAGVWIRRLLIVTVSFFVLKLFGVVDLIFA